MYHVGIRDDFMPIEEELTVLTFTSGTRRGPTSRRCRTISVIDDDAVESNETFTAVLNRTLEDIAVVNLSNGFQSATVTIIDDINDREYKLKCMFWKPPSLFITSPKLHSTFFRYDSQFD